MCQLPNSPKASQLIEFQDLVEERVAHMQTLQQFNDLQAEFDQLLKTSSFKKKNCSRVLSKQERKRYSQMQLYLERFGSSEVGVRLGEHRVLKC